MTTSCDHYAGRWWNFIPVKCSTRVRNRVIPSLECWQLANQLITAHRIVWVCPPHSTSLTTAQECMCTCRSWEWTYSGQRKTGLPRATSRIQSRISRCSCGSIARENMHSCVDLACRECVCMCVCVKIKVISTKLLSMYVYRAYLMKCCTSKFRNYTFKYLYQPLVLKENFQDKMICSSQLAT